MTEMRCAPCNADIGAGFDANEKRRHQGWLMWRVVSWEPSVEARDLCVCCATCRQRLVKPSTGFHDMPLEWFTGENAMPTLDRMVKDYMFDADGLRTLCTVMCAAQELPTSKVMA